MSSKKSIALPRMYPRRDALPRAKEILSEVQKTLLPKHEADFIAINLESSEYVLAPTSRETMDAFREKWPDVLPFVMRVNGEPVVKFHGK